MQAGLKNKEKIPNLLFTKFVPVSKTMTFQSTDYVDISNDRKPNEKLILVNVSQDPCRIYACGHEAMECFVGWKPVIGCRAFVKTQWQNLSLPQSLITLALKPKTPNEKVSSYRFNDVQTRWLFPSQSKSGHQNKVNLLMVKTSMAGNTFVQNRGRDIDPKNVFTVQDGMIRISGEEWGGSLPMRNLENYRAHS